MNQVNIDLSEETERKIQQLSEELHRPVEEIVSSLLSGSLMIVDKWGFSRLDSILTMLDKWQKIQPEWLLRIATT